MYSVRIYSGGGGYFQIRRSGGLDLTSGLEAKSGVRSGQVHKIRGKNWEVLSPKDAKVGKSSNFGVISEIQRAKFGVFVIYIFGGKIWGSNKNFRGKIWGQAPRPPDMEVPPLGIYFKCEGSDICVDLYMIYN